MKTIFQSGGSVFSLYGNEVGGGTLFFCRVESEDFKKSHFTSISVNHAGLRLFGVAMEVKSENPKVKFFFDYICQPCGFAVDFGEK